jgi:hypothetical protein
MKKPKLLLFCFLIPLLASIKAYSQDCDIDVVIQVVNASSSQANGGVNFKMKDQSSLEDRFIIFDLTAVKNGTESGVRLKGSSLGHLLSGKYEFLIVDRKKEKCVKEVLVEIKEQ